MTNRRLFVAATVVPSLFMLAGWISRRETSLPVYQRNEILAACPVVAYVDPARVFREADAAKTEIKLLNATWAPKQDAAKRAIAEAKKLKGPSREKAVETATAALQRSIGEATADQEAGNAKVNAALDAAAKKLHETRGMIVLREIPAAGGVDVTPEIIALMNEGTPEAVAELKAARDRIAALEQQLASARGGGTRGGGGRPN